MKEEDRPPSLIEDILKEPIEQSFRNHPKVAAVRMAFGSLAFYFVWFACVWGAVQGRAFLGPLLVLASVVTHILISHQRCKDVFLICAVSILGSILDTLYIQFGIFDYVTPNTLFLGVCPLWVTSLYFLYGMTVDHSLSWLGRYPWPASVFGGMGGFFSYWAGVRMGAIVPHWEFWAWAMLVGAVWALFVPFCFVISKRLHPWC